MSGSLAHAGRPEHPVEAAAVDAALAERYGRATDPARRVELLEAMGTSDGPAPARAAAARSLRLTDAPETDELLLAAIAGNRDAAVRDAALFAARYRPFDRYLDATVRTAESDPEEYVRNAAVGLLAAHLAAAPKVREALTQVAEHDPKRGVRKLAHTALTGSSSESASTSASP
jgi:hypothetical protein